MISGTTRVLGVIGDPVAHTASPAMHNAALRALNLNYVYAAFRVAPAALPQALAGMRAFGMVGLNVTVPHKQAVMAHLDEISTEAQSIGAVNTIANRDGRLVGYNTDAFGIVQSLKADSGLDPLPPKGRAPRGGRRSAGRALRAAGAGGSGGGAVAQPHGGKGRRSCWRPRQ